MDRAITRYARTSDGDSIAYQVLGGGPFDLVHVPGVRLARGVVLDIPADCGVYQRLASFSQLILFDKRGTGPSDPLSGPQPLEERAKDVFGCARSCCPVAARVRALADPGDVLASNTVKELVLGSGISFEDRATHTLRGVPDRWQLHAVLPDST